MAVGRNTGFEIEEGIGVRKGELLAPHSGRFSPETMRGVLSPERIEKLFPNFSEQHSSSNLIL